MAEQVIQRFQVGIQFHQVSPFSLSFEQPEHQEAFCKMQKDSKIRMGILAYLRRTQELAAVRVPRELRTSLPRHFFEPARVLVAFFEMELRCVSNQV